MQLSISALGITSALVRAAPSRNGGIVRKRSRGSAWKISLNPLQVTSALQMAILFQVVLFAVYAVCSYGRCRIKAVRSGSWVH